MKDSMIKAHKQSLSYLILSIVSLIGSLCISFMYRVLFLIPFTLGAIFAFKAITYLHKEA